MHRLRFLLLYFLTWLGYFVLSKLVFLLYHHEQTARLSWTERLKVLGYGLQLDASFTAYVCVLPFLLVTLSYLLPRPGWKSSIRWYTYILVVLTALMHAGDLQLYREWGFRLDATPVQYLSSPGEVGASVAAAPVLLLTVIWIGLSVVGIVLFRLVLKRLHPTAPVRPAALYAFVSLFLTAVLVLPMRGGWQQIPINQSAVYFSDKAFANHAGINVPWNVLYSLQRNDFDQQNPYQYLPETEAAARVDSLYQVPAGAASDQVLNTTRPNVLLIILESFTGNLVGSVGGEPGVTPNLDSIARTGLLFQNFYASGDRSEKGMVALLSGYPVQPTTSVMKIPRKTEKLPYLSRELKQQGYRTAYYYGGELGFANFRSYLLNGAYDQLVEKKDFDPKDYNSKWGVHDHVLFDRVLVDLNRQQGPFFTSVFTLSSHEPFETPRPPVFKGTDESTLFRNSMHYADWALGQFLNQAKQQPWWQNTLVILVADHGHRHPHELPNHDIRKFRIPMIWTGGAMAKPGVVEQIGSQTDLATTLLRQLNLPSADFHWGKDLLNPAATPFAFYVFNNGFGWVWSDGHYAFDNVAKKVLEQEGPVSEEELKNGKAYLQESYADFLRK